MVELTEMQVAFRVCLDCWIFISHVPAMNDRNADNKAPAGRENSIEFSQSFVVIDMLKNMIGHKYSDIAFRKINCLNIEY